MSLLTRTFFLSIIIACYSISPTLADGHSDRGSKEEAKILLDRAVNLVNLNEVVGFTMITIPNTGFQTKDLYPFCFDKNGILLAHPYGLGDSIKELVSEDGVKVGVEMLKNAKKKQDFRNLLPISYF